MLQVSTYMYMKCHMYKEFFQVAATKLKTILRAINLTHEAFWKFG